MEETITCETVGVKFQSERDRGNKGKEIKRLLPCYCVFARFPNKLAYNHHGAARETLLRRTP
jgi:hypothetical protein